MIDHRTRYTCLYLFVGVLALLVIAAPVAACTTPTPTPTPTPAPAPTPSFSCGSDYSLTTQDGTVVGCVAVTNDAQYLYANFYSAPSVQMIKASLNVSDSFAGIPQDTNGVPLPNQFLLSYTFNSGEQSHSFDRVDISQYVSHTEYSGLYVSAYAQVAIKSAPSCTWIASTGNGDGSETYVASSNPKLGPDSSQTTSPRSGKAVLAYTSQYTSSSLYLASTKASFSFTTGKFIWESNPVKDPWKGDIVNFTKTFTLNGAPVSGTLWITADDGYDVSLNGGEVGTKGLNPGWLSSNLKYAYVPGHGLWKSVEQYDLVKTGLLKPQGTNTLFIQTANRYMGCDNYLPPGVKATDTDNPPDSGDLGLAGGGLVGCGGTCAEPKGTIYTNIGALIFEANICTGGTSTKDAWVLSTDAMSPDKTLKDKTGAVAKYFPYRIKRRTPSVNPFFSIVPLPGQTSQTLTATVYDEINNLVTGQLLTFNTTFGSFPNGKTLATNTTDSSGTTTMTVSSSTPGMANIDVWIDENGNGKLDPYEWTNSAIVEWVIPTTLDLEPGTATVQLPTATDQVLTATVRDQDNFLMKNAVVTFTTTFRDGSTSVTTTTKVQTDDNGVAQTTLTETTAGTARVTAFADLNGNGSPDPNEPQGTSTITWQAPPAPATITLSASPATVKLQDTTTVSLTAKVKDQYDHIMPQTQVTFTISFSDGTNPPTITPVTALTDASGIAQASVRETTPGTATIDAKSGGATSNQVIVTWTDPPRVTTLTLSPPSASLQLNSPVSQIITATILDQKGKPMSGIPVTFTIVLGSGSTQTSTVNTDINGQASVTVTSSVADTATVTANAGGLSATSTVTWLAAPKPATIALTGSPSTIQLPDTTPVSLTAILDDQYGQPMPNMQVTFTTAFSDGTNPVTTIVTTDSSGVARTMVTETTAGTATITATSGDATSNQLTAIWLAAPQPTPTPTLEPTPDPTLTPAPDPTPDPAAGQS